MCGICGAVGLGGAGVEHETLARMCAALVRRGPDDEGIHTFGSAGLAQRRLSVIDLSRAALAPLSNETGTVWVTLNGEIYNFQALRADLVSRGHVFRTSSDTEVLVHLYEEYGVDCVAKLRGMFAFAIWDVPRQRLLAARDRLGKKPFFYTTAAGSFIFASSIAALRRHPDVTLAPNYRAIDSFLDRQYVPSPETAFTDIYKLPPGHLLLVGPDEGLTVRRYWRPPLALERGRAHADPRGLGSELLERLEEAVRLRMIADVPLGAFLSGGVDSAAIVALMARASGRPVKTFTIGFDEADFDETRFARAVAERYSTDHHEFVVRPDAVSVLPDLVRDYGEPFGDASALATYYLAKLTRQHVTVALSGDGGDETFGGYENYRIVSAWSRADVVPGPARTALKAGVTGVLERMPYHPAAARVSRAWTMIGSGTAERFRLQSSVLKPEEKRAAYTPRFRDLIAAAPAAACGPASVAFDPRADPLDWMMWHDQQFYLPDCLMVKVDVASMAHSLEVRSPLLDHEFVEFAAAIPPSLKRDDTGGKVILKRAVAHLLPPATLQRPKKGFGVPLRTWFGRELLELARGTLLDDRARRRGLLEPAFVSRMLDDLVARRYDWSHRLWALLWLELWFREFVD